MIGSLILEFENRRSQTVQTFNEIFRDSPLNINEYPSDAEVEIGPVFNGVRQLIINGEVIHHELLAFGSAAKRAGKSKRGKGRTYDIRTNEGKFLGRFTGILNAMRELNIEQGAFYAAVHAGKIILEEVKK